MKGLGIGADPQIPVEIQTAMVYSLLRIGVWPARYTMLNGPAPSAEEATNLRMYDVS